MNAARPENSKRLWADIPGWVGWYQVSNDGLVRSLDRRIGARLCRGQIIAQRKSANGYMNVGLYRQQKAHCCATHRLVLMAFVGLPQEANYVCLHLDGKRSNNGLSNLRWGTQKENEADKARHGTRLLGEQSPRAKLKASDVLQMRRLFASGLTKTEIARNFGMSRYATHAAITGRTWGHL